MARLSEETNGEKDRESVSIAYFGGAARTVREAWGLPNQVETAAVQPARLSRGHKAAIGLLGAVAAALVGVIVWQTVNVVPDGVALDGETFPESGLLKAAEAFDSNDDGYLSNAEAASAYRLNLSGCGLTSLDGISVFTNLQYLDVSDNNLESVDLSFAHELLELDISDNNVRELDLTGMHSLQALDVSGNDMQQLTLSGCTGLTLLSCEDNALARLDLSSCGSIDFLETDEGQNVTLPLEGNFFPDEGLRSAVSVCDADGDGALSLRERQTLSSLVGLDPETSDLTGLSWFENLQELDVSRTAITSISVDDLPSSITSLDASGCSIESVNLAGMTRLATLDLGGNPLTQIDLTDLPRLTYADLSGCKLSGALDVTQNFRLAFLNVSGNRDLAQVCAWGVEELLEPGAVVCDSTCTVLLEEPQPDAAEGETAEDADEAEADGEDQTQG